MVIRFSARGSKVWMQIIVGAVTASERIVWEVDDLESPKARNGTYLAAYTKAGAMALEMAAAAWAASKGASYETHSDSSSASAAHNRRS